MSRALGVLLALLLLLVSACGGDDGSGGAGGPAAGSAAGEPGKAGGSDVLTWGDGDYGVVLAHGAAFDAASWEVQATAIAEQGATVVAVEDIGTEAIEAAVQSLRDDGIERVALVGGSAGADAILRLASEQPYLADQLVLLSPNTVVDGLGEEPKLFIASEGEPGTDVPQELVDASEGDDNQTLIVRGSAHAQNIFDTEQGAEVMAALLERLDVA
ncbi:alpha/beta hydrolase [Nocardioides sp.]|uniref:alpha/beta fold hydrolase n=1 Tax=Nocardioides sp. TaxID=35761 RepID=UPI0023A59D93|nr:alpha/beta hydrolase [Nocardioides sp.]MDE0774935.1 alpha/beta hydrolase [Nocardioides sp.]